VSTGVRVWFRIQVDYREMDSGELDAFLSGILELVYLNIKVLA